MQRFDKLFPYVWAYNLATYYQNSWGNNAFESGSYFLMNIALDARQYSKVAIVGNVPQTMCKHLNLMGYSIKIQRGDFIEDGYGQMVGKAPKITSADPQSYLYLYAGYERDISNSDIRTDDGLYESTKGLFPLMTIDERERLIKEGSGKNEPVWWYDFYNKLLKGKK